MEAIADASSLIVLARLNALWLLKRLFGPVAIVPEVEAETVGRGKAKGYRDALAIEAAIQVGDLIITPARRGEQLIASSLRQNSTSLSYTDCVTLACARERVLTLIMEDQRAKNVAVAQGIQHVVIQVLPVQGFIGYKLSYEEGDDLIGRIGKAMHTDPAIVNTLRSAVREIHDLRAGQTAQKDRDDDSTD